MSRSLLLLLPLLAVASAQYDYAEVLSKSVLFYEAQRSGTLPSDNRIEWRGDSATDDCQDIGRDCDGGYYDAGDHVKFGFPMAFSVTNLAWGGVTFKAGYDAAGETDNFKNTLMWGTDYFLKAWNGNEFVGQVGDGDQDHAYWGRPEDMTMARPAFTISASAPGSDLAGETAAALAASSMYYSSVGDSAAADAALNAARELFDLADQNRGKYTDSIPQAANFYNSWSGYEDELGWSAAWMYKATGEQTYMDKAIQFYNEFTLSTTPSEFSWDDKKAGVQVLMYDITGDAQYRTAAETFIDWFINQAPRTPDGIVFIQQWGSLRHASNVAHICAQAAALGIREQECNAFVVEQMGLILGDTGRSFVVGYGTNPPERPHHRSSSCEDMPAPCDWDDFNNPGPNPQTLNGALVGGPKDQSGTYVDDRGDYTCNEVACDYNAGFQGVLASLVAGGLKK